MFEIEDSKGRITKTNLSDWINNSFLKAEKAHQQQQQTPFIYRFKAHYCSQNREVTLLAFRLKGSKKVSIIYTTDKNIFAKTLRRHWFQRT